MEIQQAQTTRLSVPVSTALLTVGFIFFASGLFAFSQLLGNPSTIPTAKKIASAPLKLKPTISSQVVIVKVKPGIDGKKLIAAVPQRGVGKQITQMNDRLGNTDQALPSDGKVIGSPLLAPTVSQGKRSLGQ